MAGMTINANPRLAATTWVFSIEHVTCHLFQFWRSCWLRHDASLVAHVCYETEADDVVLYFYAKDVYIPKRI